MLLSNVDPLALLTGMVVTTAILSSGGSSTVWLIAGKLNILGGQTSDDLRDPVLRWIKPDRSLLRRGLTVASWIAVGAVGFWIHWTFAIGLLITTTAVTHVINRVRVRRVRHACAIARRALESRAAAGAPSVDELADATSIRGRLDALDARYGNLPLSKLRRYYTYAEAAEVLENLAFGDVGEDYHEFAAFVSDWEPTDDPGYGSSDAEEIERIQRLKSILDRFHAAGGTAASVRDSEWVRWEVAALRQSARNGV